MGEVVEVVFIHLKNRGGEVDRFATYIPHSTPPTPLKGGGGGGGEFSEVVERWFFTQFFANFIHLSHLGFEVVVIHLIHLYPPLF